MYLTGESNLASNTFFPVQHHQSEKQYPGWQRQHSDSLAASLFTPTLFQVCRHSFSCSVYPQEKWNIEEEEFLRTWRSSILANLQGDRSLPSDKTLNSDISFLLSVWNSLSICLFRPVMINILDSRHFSIFYNKHLILVSHPASLLILRYYLLIF